MYIAGEKRAACANSTSLAGVAEIGWWPCWLVVVVFQLREWSSVLVVLKDMQATCLMVLVHAEEGLLLK